jgi:hypothetical protein
MWHGSVVVRTGVFYKDVYLHAVEPTKGVHVINFGVLPCLRDTNGIHGPRHDSARTCILGTTADASAVMGP